MTTEQEKPQVRTIWKLLAFAGLAFVGLVLSTIGASSLKFILSQSTTNLIAGPTAVAALVLATWACVKMFDRQPIAAVGIGFDRPWILHMLGGWLGGTLLVGVCWLTYWVCGWSHVSVNPELSSQWAKLGAIALIILSMASVEELITRGYAFQILMCWNRVVGILFFGVLFAALHFGNEGGAAAISAINVFLAHLFFVACYLRTRSLWLPIGLHAGWNFALGSVFGMPVSGHDLGARIFVTHWERNIWTGRDFGPEGGLVTTIVLIVATACVWKLVKQRRPLPDLLTSLPQ